MEKVETHRMQRYVIGSRCHNDGAAMKRESCSFFLFLFSFFFRVLSNLDGIIPEDRISREYIFYFEAVYLTDVHLYVRVRII